MNPLRTLLLVGSLLLTAFLVTQLILRRVDDGPPASPPAAAPSPISIEGWSYRDGEVNKTEDGAYETPTGFEIEQLGLEIAFDAESRFRFEEGVPMLETGGMEVRAAKETTFGPFQIPPGSELRFDEQEIVIGRGGVLIDGTFIPANTRLPRRSGPSAAPTLRAQSPGGRVVDAATGEPLVGARVLLRLSDHPDGTPTIDDDEGNFVEARTDSAGRFEGRSAREGSRSVDARATSTDTTSVRPSRPRGRANPNRWTGAATRAAASQEARPCADAGQFAHHVVQQPR